VEREFDVVVVGSGFGGSVAALRLAEKGYRVAVLEAGRRFGPDDLPRTSWQLRRFLWLPRLGCRGIQRLTLLRGMLVLSGAGVGGGSLVYANTLYEPPADVWDDPAWGAELAPWYEHARRMLGACEFPGDTPADEVMRAIALRLGVSQTFRHTPVGVWFGEDGVDPYFGGVGPLRNGCTQCGGCMIGCRFGAKNSLDRNYLWLAERLGVAILPEREARLLRRRAGGWEIVVERPGAWFGRRRETFVAEQVVLAAGVLGTLKLLLRSGVGGPRVGELVRTNSEALVGASARRTTVDYSRGVAITSSIHPSPDTHVEPVRYPRGSNVMGLLGTILVDGGGRLPRQLRFLGLVAAHPLRFLRSLSVRRWSERTIILLVMQTRRSALRVRLRRGRLTTERTSEPVPSYIPVANEAARIAAELIDGDPGSSLNEVLLDVPTTAHVLGGACVGTVLDRYHRVCSEPGLHVVDGSAISANLGVNPSLTIVAQAERALSLWPNRGEVDPRPPLGAAYEVVAPVAPRRPVVPADAPAALGPVSPEEEAAAREPRR
jgi:cholesterol oxidase